MSNGQDRGRLCGRGSREQNPQGATQVETVLAVVSHSVTVTGCAQDGTDFQTVSELDTHSEDMDHSPSAHETQIRSEQDVPSDHHITWLMKAQTDNIIILAKIKGAQDPHDWDKATVKGWDTGGKWQIEWEHKSTHDTLKSECEIKTRSLEANQWQKTNVQHWKKNAEMQGVPSIQTC